MKVTTENLTEALTLLKNRMHEGVVSFTYLKKDGSERTAKGTLNIDTMGAENAPKGVQNVSYDTATRYYDMNSEGWRSFTNINLVSIDD